MKDKFERERSYIKTSLEQSGISNVMFNKDNIPTNLPCAIVILETEEGIKGTARQFTDTFLGWSVFLIINAHNVKDPDFELYVLKECFREHYRLLAGKDVPHIEYYTSRIDGTRLVRIAKLELSRNTTGAGS